MSDAQLYLAIGIPVIINLLFNGVLILFLRADVAEVRSDLKTITGKLAEMDNRLTRVEIKLGIQP